jgi:hypothetical protein
MSRTLAIVGGLLLVIVAAAYGGLWLMAQRAIPLSVSLPDRGAALNNADRITALGAEPGKWPVRLFVPAGALQDLAGTIAGTSYRLPFGEVGPQGPEGYLVAKIRKLAFTPTDFQLRAHVEMDVTYLPVTRSQWWGGTTVRFAGQADMLPVGGAGGGAETINFRLVPTRFAPSISWGPLNFAAREMLSQIAASHLLQRLGHDLLIPIPPLTVPIDVKAGMVAVHEGKFPVQGGYKITARLDGQPLHGEISTDRLLIVSSGIWLLGGLPGQFDPRPLSSANTQAELDKRALAIQARLAPFERKSGHAEAHIPIAPILSLVEAPPGVDPANYNLRVAITEATGAMFRHDIANNRIVGDVGLVVSPASPDFASGTLSFAPPKLQWQKGFGLAGRLDATAYGQARVRASLSGSRVGEIKSADLGVSGATKTSLPFTLGLKLIQERADSALVLVPELGCTRMALDLRQDPGTGPLFSTGWFSLESAGVRVERNIGGGMPAFVALIDSKPRYVPFPAEGPLAEGVTYPSDGIALTTAPKALVIGENGVDVVVSLHARSASKAEEAGFASDREALLAAFRKGFPARVCDPDQRFKLLLGS